jgi:hypothetical protein
MKTENMLYRSIKGMNEISYSFSVTYNIRMGIGKKSMSLMLTSLLILMAIASQEFVLCYLFDRKWRHGGEKEGNESLVYRIGISRSL